MFVAQAAVVPVAHDIKGQGIYAFVSLMNVRGFLLTLHYGIDCAG